MDKLFKFRKSLTKNWPGGRKNATVHVQDGKDRSFYTWNHAVVNTKATWTEGVRSYLAPAPKPSEGGMAEV